ncbi:MAG: hypothetical protein PHW04_17195 [Candidatus Wallbacteria bacterium]|nr:hypothetical protein [Candidatus Wallbacteria bacterium]
MGKLEKLDKIARIKKNRKLKTAGLLIFTLICGILLGSGITLKVIWGGFVKRMNHTDSTPDFMTHCLKKELSLNENQVKLIEVIVKKQIEAMEKLHTQFKPLREAELEKFCVEIEAVLTPDQVKIWDDKFDQLAKNFNFERRSRNGHKSCPTCTKELSSSPHDSQEVPH